MRIVIDLESCQHDAAPALPALLPGLCAAAGAHEVWAVLSDRHPDAIDPLRRALAGLLPPERVRVYDLPPPTAGAAAAVRAREAALIRAQFFAVLGADAVLLPAGAAPLDDARYAVLEAGPDDGEDAGAAVLARLEAAVRAHARAPAAPGRRARLAYVSPLPPARSGIADYSAELAPQLARYYDITLVVDTEEDAQAVSHPALAGWTVRSGAWFDRHAHDFERVLYHFGNSHAHRHMFELIERHPGVVVLHDFFFSGVLDNLEREGYLEQAFLRTLFASHGYTGLREHARIGRNPAIWKYPLNKPVLDQAVGVIVHSDYSKELARAWYGAEADQGWRTVPLLRGAAPGRDGDDGDDVRGEARRRLGLKPDDFVVCSFGMLGRTKMNEELLDAWLMSPLAAERHCRLVFVGQNEPGMYGAAIEHKIGAAERIAITGFVDAEAYADWLLACDCAVQLRTQSRGETSAAVLDCLLYGAPTIVNAHGATASIDGALLHKLPDRFSNAELAEALALLHGDRALRLGYGERARAHLRREHDPVRVGQLMAEAIEDFAARSPKAHYARLLDELGQVQGAQAPSDADLIDLARAIAFNQGGAGPRQLLIDVSPMIMSDLKTGIQRVVRSVLLALIADPPPGWRIEPVYSTGGNRHYHYARQWTLGFIGVQDLALEDAPCELRPGDTFLGLDLFTNGTAQNRALLQSMRDHGVQVYFTIYDILPMLRPDVFPFGTEEYFGDFLRTVHQVAHGVVCISRSVADELTGWIEREGLGPRAPFHIGWFHLGADIDASAPSSGLPDNAAEVLAAVAARPSLLMVGTVEPRKGHAQALAAFELLWRDGVEVNLVIVGKKGWMVDALAERMAGHPEAMRRLFWLPGVSDEMLLKLYGSCAALLAASEGEGFGLPLIEAAQHGIPIIARALPVFREVAREHAFYFDGLEPADLAAAVRDWLALWREGKAPPSGAMPWLTWDASARQVVDAVIGQQWYRTLHQDGHEQPVPPPQPTH
jgi:glycosyltransferase involved in cell wall biosynthesis